MRLQPAAQVRADQAPQLLKATNAKIRNRYPVSQTRAAQPQESPLQRYLRRPRHPHIVAHPITTSPSTPGSGTSALKIPSAIWSANKLFPNVVGCTPSYVKRPCDWYPPRCAWLLLFIS